MDNRNEKDKSRHANLPTQHQNSPLRAVRRTEIRATTHLAESSAGTSTPLPPPLVPAPAAASSRPTTTHNYMPVLFKKPNPPKKGLVKAKEKFPLQRSIEKSINAMMISKNDLDGEKADNLDGVSNKNFDKKAARLDGVLTTLHNKSNRPHENTQIQKKKPKDSLPFNISSLLAPDKKSRASHSPNLQKLRDEQNDSTNCQFEGHIMGSGSSNRVAVPTLSCESSSAFYTKIDSEESPNLQKLRAEQNDSTNCQFEGHIMGSGSSNQGAVPPLSCESSKAFYTTLNSEKSESYDESRRRMSHDKKIMRHSLCPNSESSFLRDS